MSAFFSKPAWILYAGSHVILVLLGFLIVSGSGTSTLWFAVGASLIAAGITGLTTFGYILVTDGVRERLQNLLAFGFVGAFDARSVRIKKEYEGRLERARASVDVLGFGLNALREDFSSEFKKWKQRAKRIRILLIDPKYPADQYSYANQRDREENHPEGTIANEVVLFIKAALPHATKTGPLQIRLYRCLPTINIFRIDNEVFWGPYLAGEPSRNSPTFIVRRGGILFDRLTEHFDRIWDSSGPSVDPAEFVSEQAT